MKLILETDTGKQIDLDLELPDPSTPGDSLPSVDPAVLARVVADAMAQANERDGGFPILSLCREDIERVIVEHITLEDDLMDWEEAPPTVREQARQIVAKLSDRDVRSIGDHITTDPMMHDYWETLKWLLDDRGLMPKP